MEATEIEIGDALKKDELLKFAPQALPTIEINSVKYEPFWQAAGIGKMHRQQKACF